MVNSVFVVDACRTPIGKVKGALAEVRPDHLAAGVITALTARNAWLDVTSIEDVYWGAANQAGEDNRNVARMAVLLAGLPVEVPGVTVNRLCGSGMEAVCDAARAIAAGEADVCLAGGSESMTRAPFVLGRSADPFPRVLDLADTRQRRRDRHRASARLLRRPYRDHPAARDATARRRPRRGQHVHRRGPGHRLPMGSRLAAGQPRLAVPA